MRSASHRSRKGAGLSPQILLAAVAIVGAVALLATARQGPSEVPPPPDLVVEANTAPLGVLAALPNLGPSRVEAIAKAREARPFRSLDDLDRRVKGIGPATASGLRPFLRFDAPSPGR